MVGTLAGGLKVAEIVKNTPIKPVITEPVKPVAVKKNLTPMELNLKSVESKLSITKGEEMTFDEANELKGNINYKKDPHYSINCQSCVVANELRRRGFDVTAKPNLKRADNIPYQLSRKTEMAWIDESTNTHPVKSVAGRGVRTIQKLSNELSEIMKEQGRYHIDFVWKGTKSGHIICVEKLENGNFRFYDPQNGRVILWSDLSKRVSLFYGVKVLRVDRLQVNTDIINGVVEKL